MENQKFVLMLENDSDDRYFTQSTIKDLGISVAIRFESYNDALLSSMKEEQKPSLILLAHNTSPDVGITILKEFKSNPDLAYIPIVVITEEMSPEHIKLYYKAGANSVIKKPSSVETTTNKIGTFFRYWLSVTELP